MAVEVCMSSPSSTLDRLVHICKNRATRSQPKEKLERIKRRKLKQKEEEELALILYNLLQPHYSREVSQ